MLDISKATVQQVKSEIDRLTNALEKGLVWPKVTSLYLHGDKETNWDLGKDLGLSDESIRSSFAYCCYEEKITLEVFENGTFRVTHFNDIPLKVD